MCELGRVGVLWHRANRKHRAIISLLQNISNLWLHRLHTVKRVIWNGKLWNIHAAMHEQVSIAPLGNSGQDGPCAILCAVVFDENHSELLVVNKCEIKHGANVVNDPSATTRPTTASDWNESSMAGLVAHVSRAHLVSLRLTMNPIATPPMAKNASVDGSGTGVAMNA